MNKKHYQYRTHCFICQEKMKYYLNLEEIESSTVPKYLKDKVIIWKSCSKHFMEEIMKSDHKKSAGMSLDQVIKYNICAFSFDQNSLIKEYLSYFRSNIAHYCFQHQPDDYSFMFGGNYENVWKHNSQCEAKSVFIDLSNIQDAQQFVNKINSKIQTFQNFQ